MTLYEFWTCKDILGVICDTLEKAEKFSSESNKYCKRWFNKDILTRDFFWSTYKQYTVYTKKGTYLFVNSSLINRYKLVKFEDLVFEDTKVTKPIELPHSKADSEEFKDVKVNNTEEIKPSENKAKIGVKKHKLF